MYIAMNRFKIAPGRERDFVTVWKQRESLLETVPGFVSFHLLQSLPEADYTLFASHSTWESEKAFLAWRKSEAFKQAHTRAGSSTELYIDAPQFEGFSVVI